MTDAAETAIPEALARFGRVRPLVAMAEVARQESPERVIEVNPWNPIPGPNAVRRVRASAGGVEALVAEAEATFAAAGLPFVFELDDDTTPPDLDERLEARGYTLSGEMVCLVLPLAGPAGAALRSRSVAGVTIGDGLASQADFEACETVARAAFGGGADPALAAERYRLALRGGRRLFLARWAATGEAAGCGWASVLAGGTYLSGGAVAPESQGRGVYRAVLRARAERAAAAGSLGLSVLAMPRSEPILRRLGFVEVGRLRQFRPREPRR